MIAYMAKAGGDVFLKVYLSSGPPTAIRRPTVTTSGNFASRLDTYLKNLPHGKKAPIAISCGVGNYGALTTECFTAYIASYAIIFRNSGSVASEMTGRA